MRLSDVVPMVTDSRIVLSDSKSSVSNHARVQVPLSAPIKSRLMQPAQDLSPRRDFSYCFAPGASSANVTIELICSRISSGVLPAALSSSAISGGTYQWSLSEL